MSDDRKGQVERAMGCLLGQLAGDALGGLVEFQAPEEIRRRYPGGVRDLADGGTWNTLAGQPTDDSEMALALARMLVARGSYDAAAARAAYVRWLDSSPFDCGRTVSAGLRGKPNAASQANGALMRICPLGIFSARRDPARVAEWARQDAAITHPHPVCVQANALFALAVARAVREAVAPRELYRRIREAAGTAEASLREAIEEAENAPPADYVSQEGWVLIAFQNALWQMLHAPSLEEGVVDTVMRGGDTDTNAAICGALLGAVRGAAAVPERWRQALRACRPEAGRAGVKRPRPPEYWPVDAEELAVQLLGEGS
jgi:ADP-ribosylglycohydrolase